MMARYASVTMTTNLFMTSIERCIRQACDELYREHQLLLRNETHERTIVAQIADYLRPLFADLAIDPDYNRMGYEAEPKRALDGRRLVPDIVIHERGSRQGPNLVAIQVKGFWNREDRAKDERDLRDLAAAFHYEHLYRLELGRETYDLIAVTP